jgi:hypothetical protein
MRILFDQGTPLPLRHLLIGHDVETAFEKGWATLDNGDLLSAAEDASFQILVTTDQNLRYQQKIQNRRIAILVLPTTRWPQIRVHAPDVVAAVDAIVPGEYREVRW